MILCLVLKRMTQLMSRLQADDAQEGHSTSKVHAGLLRVAEKMEAQVTKLIEENLSNDAQTSAERGGQLQHRIVLTGHSAGGGIAALLFMHYMAKHIFVGEAHPSSCDKYRSLV